MTSGAKAPDKGRGFMAGLKPRPAKTGFRRVRALAPEGR